MGRIGLLIAAILCLLIPEGSIAQETVVKGKITDAESNDGLPFVNIYFKGTTIGVTSDFDGFYELHTSEPVDSISVSCMGYNPRTKPLKKRTNQIINFQLSSSVQQLQEIVILPGENPAFRILRKVDQYRAVNSPENLVAYQFENFTRVQVSIDNLSDKFKERKIFKPIANMFDSLQAMAGEEGKAILPIFVSENFSNYYYRRNPEARREDIIASKITGVGVDDHLWINQLMGSSFQVFNFYENWIPILGKNFISPIAKNGKSFYRYYLIDSVEIGGRTCYEMVIKPIRPLDLAFKGKMWIEDSTFALVQLDVEIGKEANLNWIEKVKVQQEFTPTSAGPWMATKTRALVDLVEVGSQPGFISKFYSSSEKIVVNDPKDAAFYQEGITVLEGAYEKDDEFWEENRHDTLTPSELNVYAMIDSVKNIPTIRSLVDIVELIVYGYQEVGGVDIGPYIFLYKFNEVEGHRFRLGFTTNEKFSHKLILKGYLAYGTGDLRYKYNAEAEYIFSRKPWTRGGIQHRDDIDQISVTDDFFSKNNLFKFTAGFNPFNRLNNSREYRIWGERVLFDGFNQIVMFHHRQFRPFFDFGYYPDQSDQNLVRSEFTTSTISLESRYSARERYVYTHLDRIRIPSGQRPPPVYTLKYTVGIKGLLGGDFAFHKIILNIEQTLPMGTLGKSVYSVTGGKVINILPYPLLQVHKGNETVVSNPDAFYLMNFFEFVSDNWVSVFYEHHFEGLFTNRVPLLKKLKVRTLVMGNMVYGQLNKRNNIQIDKLGFPLQVKDEFDNVISESFSTLESRPYIETGVGLENILNFIRLDAVWRITYTNKQYQDVYPRKIHPFGLKASF
ncbi:MAG: carboxypeptidase-like regulatory domain-containing protein, partial [Flavobacteriales bacterium]|nr:carboxypeptidase-like regulatory domain-containing protein [Flavobacteriales bacterium]